MVYNPYKFILSTEIPAAATGAADAVDEMLGDGKTLDADADRTGGVN